MVRKGKLIPRHCLNGTELGETKKLEDEWEIDYRPLEEISKHMQEVVPEEEMATYPTSYRPDQQEDPGLRIDGVFVNKTLAGSFRPKLHIIHSDAVEKLSDHYPLYIMM